jgi:hypothetical protein
MRDAASVQRIDGKGIQVWTQHQVLLCRKTDLFRPRRGVLILPSNGLSDRQQWSSVMSELN